MNMRDFFDPGPKSPFDRTPGSPIRVAVVAACMARNCTPEETDKVMEMLYSKQPPDKASDIQAQLDSVINEVKGKEPDLDDLQAFLFQNAPQEWKDQNLRKKPNE